MPRCTRAVVLEGDRAAVGDQDEAGGFGGHWPGPTGAAAAATTSARPGRRSQPWRGMFSGRSPSFTRDRPPSRAAVDRAARRVARLVGEERARPGRRPCGPARRRAATTTSPPWSQRLPGSALPPCRRCRPGLSAGPPGVTAWTQTPLATGELEALARAAGRARGRRRRGRRSGPCPRWRSWASERRTASTGTAKPTPVPSPLVGVDLRVDARGRRPSASSSGPPELPWLIAASVWIAPAVRSPSATGSSGRWPRRRRPTATAPRRTGSRSRRPARRPRRPRSSRAAAGAAQAVGVDLQQRDVGERVEADDLGRHLVAVREADVDRGRRRIELPSPLGDDVGVGRDLAVAGDHEAGAQADDAPLPAVAAQAGGDDGHDARALALVDRRGVEARSRAVARALLDDLDARRPLDGRACARRRSSPRVAPQPPPQPAERSQAGEGAGGAGRGSGGSSGGELQREGGAAGLALDDQLAVHALGELVGDREPEARALGVVGGDRTARRCAAASARGCPVRSRATREADAAVAALARSRPCRCPAGCASGRCR